MDATSVVGCFRDRTILITGSTGFLGKLLVEKILRVQPNVKKLYLMVRATDAASAEQRILSQVVGKDLFNTTREKHGLAGFEKLIEEKIVPIAGDIGTQNFGLDSSTVDDRPMYDVALASNALGAKYICKFAKKCGNLKLFLHLSTVFVSGIREGLITEKALQMGETVLPGHCLDIKAELQLVDKVNELQLVAIGIILFVSQKDGIYVWRLDGVT